MTFTELQTEILDRLNLSSSTASTRIGRAINRKYRLITTSIGLQLSRRVTVSKVVTIGGSSVTFSNCEKIIEVVNRSVTPYRSLKEVSIEEIEAAMPFASGDTPTCYAITSQTSNSITIQMNRVAVTGFTLYADVHQTIADLSGTATPAFPESFHDIIIEGVISDELRKMEKASLAAIASKEYERILSDLRMWIAKSNYIGDTYQGKYLSGATSPNPNIITDSGGGSSGSGSGTDLTTAALMMRISLRA